MAYNAISTLGGEAKDFSDHGHLWILLSGDTAFIALREPGDSIGWGAGGIHWGQRWGRQLDEAHFRCVNLPGHVRIRCNSYVSRGRAHTVTVRTFPEQTYSSERRRLRLNDFRGAVMRHTRLHRQFGSRSAAAYFRRPWVPAREKLVVASVVRSVY
jgi:hypothetical protein